MFRQLFFATCFLTGSACAAMAQGADPRMPGEAMKFLQNEMTFLGARVNILQQDLETQRRKLCDLVADDKKPEECKSGNKP